MKILTALAAAVLVLAFAASSTAQEQAPDEDLLGLACEYVAALAVGEGLNVRWCRRASEARDGNRAVVQVALKVREYGEPFLISVRFTRSLWSVQTFSVDA